MESYGGSSPRINQLMTVSFEVLWNNRHHFARMAKTWGIEAPPAAVRSSAGRSQVRTPSSGAPPAQACLRIVDCRRLPAAQPIQQRERDANVGD
jgi:hypothetical protein